MGDVTTQAQNFGHESMGNVASRNSGRDNRGVPRFPSRGAFAALDLGTNNCRLLIARPNGNDFTIVDSFSRIVRLGEGLSASGVLSEIAMDRTLTALSTCADKLKRSNIIMARSVATEACRRARNGVAFVDRVYHETGISLDIISPQEEARLAVLGCHTVLEAGDGPALIFDIGGGSTELIIVEQTDSLPKILDWLSVPWGVVSLSEAEPHDSQCAAARAAAYRNMRARVDESFAALAGRSPAPTGPNNRLVGTSGTVTTLTSVLLGLEFYDRKQVDGQHVSTNQMKDICASLAGLSVPERAELPCIGRERADLVVAGCAILESIFDLWPAPRVGVADRGIREGVLRQLMASARRR
jgi:exopolyphosphatase / guanosine-5'-triphosphate,3'-diphosphate pyrophosphatase